MKLVADDDLVLFAEVRGRTVGFCLTLPDVNEILSRIGGRLFPFGIFRLMYGRRGIRGARMLVLCTDPGFRSMGIVALLIRKIRENVIRKGYVRAELATVLESNVRMRKIIENLGFAPAKRYRLYEAGIRRDGKGQ